MVNLRESRVLDPTLETESPAARQHRLGERLCTTVGHAWARAPRVRRTLEVAGLSPRDIRGLDDLPRIPITRKDALPAMQADEPPFGGLLGVQPGQLARIFMSPGPIYDPEGAGNDFWRFRHGLAAAGFRRGEIAHNAASYHLTPLGFMLDAAARALGCVVIPAGVGQTELQVKLAAHVGATAYLGTPSFLYTLLTKAREVGTPLRFEAAFVVAEMLPEPLRAELEQGFDVRVLQGYGTADLGCLAYECPEKGGWHLHPEAIVEVLDLETGTAAAAGQPGEVVATIFDEAYPLLRFATGDLSSLAPDTPCGCGRTAAKLTGLLGRVGEGIKVKGMFVRVNQLDAVMRRFPSVSRYQATVTREQHQDQLAYTVELTGSGPLPNDLASRIADSLREELKVRGEVRIVPAGTIPDGSKKINDCRVWK